MLVLPCDVMETCVVSDFWPVPGVQEGQQWTAPVYSEAAGSRPDVLPGYTTPLPHTTLYY